MSRRYRLHNTTQGVLAIPEDSNPAPEEPNLAPDILWRKRGGNSPGYDYKPLAELAKPLFSLYCTPCGDGWYALVAGPEDSLWEGLNLHEVSATNPAPSPPSPDGPELVPLPTRPVHRYTLLGYTPAKFGEHERS